MAIRDARYNQVVHMMTAAKGAEKFYQLDNNPSRSEGLAMARDLDTKAANVSIEAVGFSVERWATLIGIWFNS